MDWSLERRDSKLHALGCFSIVAWVYVALLIVWPSLAADISLDLAITVALVVGIWRELTNMTGWDWSDIYADLVGIGAASFIINWSI